MTNKFLHLSSLVLLLFILLVGANAQEVSATKSQPTIAVLGTTPELSDLCALVEAGLFQKGIILVERLEIDKVLQEQKLTAAGLVDRNNLLKLGQLLRADGFLLISVEETAEQKDQKENKDKLLRIRLIDTAHGLRFLDTFETWDNTKLKETTERITENVSAIAPKLILPPDKAIPIGIVGIYRVELDERYQWLTRTLPIMLSARLNKEPRIIMLEREDLKRLLEEKQLTQGKDIAFWGSAILIDGYLQKESQEGIKLQGDEKEIKLTLQMKDFADKETAIFTGLINPEEPLTTIDKIATNIIQKLSNASSTTLWDPKKEAEEFFLHGYLLSKHGRHQDAIAPLETAYALQPDNILYIGTIFENEWYTRFTECTTDAWSHETGISYYSDLELAEIVSRLIRKLQTECENGSLSLYYFFKFISLLAGGPPGMGYLMNSASVSTKEVRDINRENRRLLVEIVEQVKKKYPPTSEMDYPTQSLCVVYISSDDPDELIKNIKETFAKLIMPPEDGGILQSFDTRYESCESQFLSMYRYFGKYNISEKSHLIGKSEKFKELWQEYVKELTETKDPLVRFSSCINLSQILKEKNKTAEAKDYCLKALDILLNELNSPNEPFVSDGWKRDWFKSDIRKQMKEAIFVADFECGEQLNILERIYEPLIKNKDCHNLALWHPNYLLCENPELTNRYFDLLERAVKVLQTCKNDTVASRALEPFDPIKMSLAKAHEKLSQLGSKEQTLFVNSLIEANSRTSLMNALLTRKTDIVKLFIENGADVNAKDDGGNTALMQASSCGYTDIVKLLVENGADVNAKDNNGWTALIHASYDGQTDIARLLIENGADVNVQDNQQYALGLAIWWRHTDIAKLLIENGADVNAKDNSGFTILMNASYFGLTDIVKLLIENGADVNAKDNNGWTALRVAYEAGHIDIVILLKQAGAKE